MIWTENDIATLKRLHAAGLSSSKIARAIGRGLTRNAVIGKAYRLGLSTPKGATGQPRRSTGRIGMQTRTPVMPGDAP